MIIRLLLAICCTLILSACTEKPRHVVQSSNAKAVPTPMKPFYTGGTPADEVKNIIMRYNELLAFGYANLTMTPLQEVANKAQAQKSYYHMAALGEGGVKMRSQFKQIEFMKIDFNAPGKTHVETREVWDYAYHDVNTGAKKENEEKKDFVYLMTYTLEQSGGRWFITDTVASGEEKKALVGGKR